jgi:hypothetical protein
MGFMQAITSFVFGDGDPNQGFEDARYAAAATYIMDHGGVVAAEEMRPYLDEAVADVGDEVRTFGHG